MATYTKQDCEKFWSENQWLLSKDGYKNSTQCHVRGPFAGCSEREIICICAKELNKLKKLPKAYWNSFTQEFRKENGML